MAGLILNPTVAAAADNSTVSLSEWQKYSHALPNPFNLDIQPTSFSGEFKVFSAKESGGFPELDEVSMSQIIAIAALVAGGVFVIDKLKSNDKTAAVNNSGENPPTTNPPTTPSEGDSCTATGGVAGTIISGVCVATTTTPSEGDSCTTGGEAGTISGGTCVRNPAAGDACTATGGIAGTLNSGLNCVASNGETCTIGGEAGTISGGTCVRNSIAGDACTATGGIAGTLNSGLNCVATDGESCTIGGEAGTISGGTCVRDSMTGDACTATGGIAGTLNSGLVCIPTEGETCTIGGAIGTITSGVCVATPILSACADDVNHADRRRVFERGSGSRVTFSGEVIDVSAGPVGFLDQYFAAGAGNVFFIDADTDMTLQINGINNNPSQDASGPAYIGRISSGGVISEVGDRVALIPNDVTPTDANFIYRIYIDNSASGVRTAYLAVDGGTNPSVCSSSDSLATGEFFLDSNYEGTATYGDSRTGFSLRGELQRGLMNTAHAIKLDNFYFIGNAEFGNYHLEYRTDFYTGDSFNVYSDSGYKRQDSGRTDLYYTKATAIKSITDKAEVYLQLSAGEISSEIYTDSRLQGFAVGMFADKIFRHDDSYHFRLSQPFGAAEVKEWRISADAVFGEAADYLRFGISHKLDGKAETKANIFYTKEF